MLVSDKRLLNNSLITLKNADVFPEHILDFLERVNSEHNFVIRDGKWQRIGLGTWSKEIDSWLLTNSLKLWDNSCPFILMHIKEIRFPYLKSLNLENNLIESVECLSRVQLPEIQLIDLANNRLTCIRSVRKIKSQKLKELALSNNKIVTFEQLPQLDSRNLEKLHVQWYRDEIFCHNPKWLLKMQMPTLKNLLLQSSSTVGKSEEIFSQLIKKSSSLQISKKRR